jgi:cytochrome P450
LRLYDPLLSIVKSTEDHSADLIIGHKVITVPADTRIILNLNALHSLPRYWGDDALEWKPSRWIHTDPGAGTVFDREHIAIPEHGAYIPWSEGMRACPGKKFSQVEHVAVMIALFGEHYVAPVRQQGETEDAAKMRALDTLKDTGMMLLLQMFHPERTPLVWRRRV